MVCLAELTSVILRTGESFNIIIINNTTTNNNNDNWHVFQCKKCLLHGKILPCNIKLLFTSLLLIVNVHVHLAKAMSSSWAKKS